MKRKVRKFDEGGNVRTRTDKEFEEDSKYGGYGRYMPKTKEYTLDEAKEKLSGLFGGGRDESKFKDLESVGGDGRRARTIEEQIGRKAEPKAEPKAETKVDFSKFDTKSYTDKPVGGGDISITGPKTSGGGGRSNAPKKEKREVDAPKKNVGEDAKPLPGVQKDKSEPKPLPNKSEDKPKESSNYIIPKKIQEERRRIVMEKRERTKSPEFPSKEDKFPLKSLLKEDKPKESSNYISPKKIQEERSRIAMKKRENDKSALENRKEYGMKKGGSVSSASSRADGIAQRGKTRGKIY